MPLHPALNPQCPISGRIKSEGCTGLMPAPVSFPGEGFLNQPKTFQESRLARFESLLIRRPKRAAQIWHVRCWEESNARMVSPCCRSQHTKGISNTSTTANIRHSTRLSPSIFSRNYNHTSQPTIATQFTRHHSASWRREFGK